MYVCICNGITDKQIRRAASAGANSLWDLQSKLGVAAGCGSCQDHAKSILAEHHGTSVFEPVMYQPSPA